SVATGSSREAHPIRRLVGTSGPAVRTCCVQRPTTGALTAMLDLLITSATVIDGTGAPGRIADVGVRDGRIVAVGEIAEDAERTIDATGLVVCPGFVDPHTHYDAQLLWDPGASPSNLHGVTTIMAGNCGFTLAPLNPEDADYLRRMMAQVEGMPLKTLETGLAWDWRTFGDYLANFGKGLGLNAGFLVGHSAIRRMVMGAEASEREATADEIEQMKELLRQSIRDGGMGFSTSLSYTHNDADGIPVGSRFASRDEVVALCSVVSEFPGTTLELVSSGCMNGFTEDEVQLFIDMSLAGQRPVNWNVLTVDSHDPVRYANQLGMSVRAAHAGARVVSLTMPILAGMNMSFGTFCGLNLLPDWGPILGLPLGERMEKLRDPEVRRFLAERATSPEAGAFMRLTGWGIYEIGDTYSEANAGLTGRLVKDIAAERGTSDFDTLLDIVLEDDLRTILWPGATDDDDQSWQMRAQLWNYPDILLGGSDAGAHLDRMCGATYTTAFLGDCIRGRKLVPLEEAVRMLTDAPAEVFGLVDRGRVAEGYFADLVVFDPETIDAGPPYLRDDLPGGTARLYADSLGMRHVFCNGVEIVTDGAATGELPGKVFTAGEDTRTVEIGLART
ncbi:MAG: D-aminoacylase, partial [Acidimicrobiales bacterium]|nr:D-aminoacylase [Acidimicrobiales bacterium]